MAGISIVGSGNVGASTAFFVAETSAVDVTLCDIREGISTGKTLDMMEAAPLRKYRSKLRGADSIDAIKDSEVVIVAVGEVRKPGNDRQSLFAENSKIVSQIARDVARLAPKSVVIMATEPVDATTTLFVRESKFERNRVLGIGGALDSARLRYVISRELSLSAENISAMVIGTHTHEMIGLPEYSRVSGVPLTQLMSSDETQRLIDEVRSSGDEIVRLAGRTSSYYAPGAVIAEVVDAIVGDLKRIFSLSVVLDGEYGVKDGAASLPMIVGRGGAVKVLEPKLGAEDKKRFVSSAQAVKASVAAGGSK